MICFTASLLTMRCCSCLVLMALTCLSSLVLALLFMNSVLVFGVMRLDARVEEMTEQVEMSLALEKKQIQKYAEKQIINTRTLDNSITRILGHTDHQMIRTRALEDHVTRMLGLIAEFNDNHHEQIRKMLDHAVAGFEEKINNHILSRYVNDLQICDEGKKGWW